MNIDDILNEWRNDAPIDKTALDDESLKVPYLHSKYLRYHNECKLKITRLQAKRKVLEATLNDYFSGRCNHPETLAELEREAFQFKLIKSEVPNYIQADSEMVNMNLKISYYEAMYEALKEILRSINTRNFVIKNAVDFMKLTMGG